ncbi:MAG: DUF2304 family protein [bacterium]|nr:DUF2304 family protein [bacterium]
MSLKMQVVIVVACLIMLCLLVRMVKNNALSLKYAMPWMLLCVGVGIFAVCTPFTAWMAAVLEIQVPSNMLFFMGFCFSLALIFGTTLTLSRMSLRLKKLTQEYALLEKEVREMRAQIEEEKEKRRKTEKGKEKQIEA